MKIQWLMIMALLVMMPINAQQLPDPHFENWAGKFKDDPQLEDWHGSNVNQVGSKFTFVPMWWTVLLVFPN